MNGGGKRPIHGAWEHSPDEWVVHSWGIDGWHHEPESPSSLDLVWPIKE